MSDIGIYIKSLFIQVMFTRKQMQGYAYGLFTDKWDMYLNTNPYFASVMAGMMDQDTDKQSFAPIIAMFGDNFIWNHLKPVILLISLIMIFNSMYIPLIVMLVIYVAIVSLIRVSGYAYGREKAISGSIMFKEWYFKISLKLMRLMKYILLGAVYGYIILIMLTYLKINPYYAILSLLIVLILLYRRYNNELIISLLIIIMYIVGL